MSEVSVSLLPEVAKFTAKSEAKPNKVPLPTLVEINPFYLKIADRIAEISGTWNPVEIFTADNVTKEKEEFFKRFKDHQEYNPVFNYSHAQSMDLTKDRETLMGLLRELRGSAVPKGGESDVNRKARAALYYKIRDDLATCDLVDGFNAGDEAKISSALHTKYRKYEDALGEEAEKIYQAMLGGEEPEKKEIKARLSAEEITLLKNQQFDAEGIKKAFEWAMDQCGMPHDRQDKPGYRVVIDEKATEIDVRDKTANGSTIVIPRNRKVSGDKLLRLIMHEIVGHARQSLNGSELFRLGGGKLKPDDETLYEGLAMRLEENFRKEYLGEAVVTPMPFYAFSVKAAENGASFWDVFSDLYKKLKAVPPDKLPILRDPSAYEGEILKEAWKYTYRVFRGHLDTSNKKSPFANPRDLVYLNGWLTDKQLVQKGHGHINEAAVFASGALQMVADYELKEENLPYKFKDVARAYWSEVLKPQMEEETKANQKLMV